MLICCPFICNFPSKHALCSSRFGREDAKLMKLNNSERPSRRLQLQQLTQIQANPYEFFMTVQCRYKFVTQDNEAIQLCSAHLDGGVDKTRFMPHFSWPWFRSYCRCPPLKEWVVQPMVSSPHRPMNNKLNPTLSMMPVLRKAFWVWMTHRVGVLICG